MSLLRELEWGDLHNWPTGLYGRIQVTRYARAAGLDEDAVRGVVCPLIEADPAAGSMPSSGGVPRLSVRIVEPAFEPGELLFADEGNEQGNAHEESFATPATDAAHHAFYEPQPFAAVRATGRAALPDDEPAPARPRLETPQTHSDDARQTLMEITSHDTAAKGAVGGSGTEITARVAPRDAGTPEVGVEAQAATVAVARTLPVESTTPTAAVPERSSAFLFLSPGEAAARAVASASATREHTPPAQPRTIDVPPMPRGGGVHDPGTTSILAVDDRRHLAAGVSYFDRVEAAPARWPRVAAAAAAVVILGLAGGAAYMLTRERATPATAAPTIAAGAALYGAPAVAEPSGARPQDAGSRTLPAPDRTAATTGTVVPSPAVSATGTRSAAPEPARGADGRSSPPEDLAATRAPSSPASTPAAPAPAAGSRPAPVSATAARPAVAPPAASSSTPASSPPVSPARAPTVPATSPDRAPAVTTPPGTAAVRPSAPSTPQAPAPSSAKTSASRTADVPTDREDASRRVTPTASAASPTGAPGAAAPATSKALPAGAVTLSGGRAVYADGGAIVVRDASGQEQRYVPAGWRGVTGLAPSADGTRLLFRVAGAGGWILTLADGSAREIVSNPSAINFVWGADGTSVDYEDRGTGEKKTWRP